MSADRVDTALYRFYDQYGELLYVGITKSLPDRLGQHDADKPWWRYVETIKVHHYHFRSQARAAEVEAIRTESPAFNIADRGEDDHPWGMRVWEREPDRRGLRRYGRYSVLRALDPDPGESIYLRWHVNHACELADQHWGPSGVDL